jgi:hypothetical protein
MYHTAERCKPVARDGRQWKKPRAGKVDEMIVQVVRTKNDDPTPADVIKTDACVDGEVILHACILRSQQSILCPV